MSDIETEQLTTWASLVRDGGPVLIAVVVNAFLLYMGYKFVFAPYQQKALEIAEASRKASEANAEAAKSQAEAAASNKALGEANLKMTAHLEKLASIILESGHTRLAS